VIFFIKGLAIGFSIAAPVGPIGVLCIRRSIAHGPLTGFLCGLGAATADAAYGCVAGFGITAIANFFVAQQLWLRSLGGAFLCYLGIKTTLSEPAKEAATAHGHGLWQAYVSTLFLTLTNPMTILSFAAVFAGLGVQSTGDNYVSAAVLVAGVFVGSAVWWLILSSGAGVLRSKIDWKWMRRVNQISGLIILVFGACALAQLTM
jgi:threonine/homoserine/homoserine lactone efflux protein